jgi:hypothetical protein
MHATAHYPGGISGCILRSTSPSDRSLPHSSEWVGFRIILFGACSTFTARCSLHARQVTNVTFCTEGFSRFVTSTTAPIATGWSESCRVGLSPTERSRLFTAHGTSV